MLYKSTCFFFSLYYPPFPWVSIMQRGVYPFLVFVAIADADGQRQGRRCGKGRRGQRRRAERSETVGVSAGSAAAWRSRIWRLAHGQGTRLRRLGTGTRDSWRAGASCVPCERGYGGFGFVGEEAEEAERGWERSIRRELDGFLELKVSGT